MKISRIIFALGAVTLLGGCAVGPGYRQIVIESGEPAPGDTDYARSLAARLTREHSVVLSTTPAPKN